LNESRETPFRSGSLATRRRDARHARWLEDGADDEAICGGDRPDAQGGSGGGQWVRDPPRRGRQYLGDGAPGDHTPSGCRRTLNQAIVSPRGMANAGERGAGRAPTPVVHAVLICDYTIRDGETGKVSVVGIFDRIFAADFPALHPGVFVYVNMADVEGEYTIGLELLRSDTMKRLGYGEQGVTYTDRLAGAELVFDLRQLIFEEPGKYEFRVYANGAHIGGKPFNVVQVKSGGGDESSRH
jgi:hypothetical protein